MLDADAINILSQHPDWMEYIPENSILTPHIKEFSRLTKETKNDFERMEIQMEFAKNIKFLLCSKERTPAQLGLMAMHGLIQQAIPEWQGVEAEMY